MANKKTNRALVGAALSIGANIEIADISGYAPLKNDEQMMQMSKEAFEMLCPDEEFHYSDSVGTGSTDMGDLSCIMPVVHPYCGGARGEGHGNNYEIYDPEAACVTNAKWQLTMLLLLLQDGGERAKKIIQEFKPRFESKEAFLAYQDSLNKEGDRIVYLENGGAQIR
jgi:metal-dependent amidase/aminoacylase/carboxypeptidase family protein